MTRLRGSRVTAVVILMLCDIVFARFYGGRTPHKQVALTEGHVEQLAFGLIRLLREQSGGLQILNAEHELLVAVGDDRRSVCRSVKRFKLSEGLFDPDPKVRRYVKPGSEILCACRYRPVWPESWGVNTK